MKNNLSNKDDNNKNEYKRMFNPEENYSHFYLNTYNNDSNNFYNKKIKNSVMTNQIKNFNNQRFNTIIQNETVEEFSRDLENPDRKDSLISRYLKNKKIIL